MDFNENTSDAVKMKHKIMKNGLLRYYVQESTYGFAIYEYGYSVALPFLQFSNENNAKLFCGKLNSGGPEEVAKQYYFMDIVGNKPLREPLKSGHSYSDWMNKNKDMFKREDRR